MNKKLKIGLWIAGGLLVLLIGYIVYRMLWMFDKTATTNASSTILQANGYTDAGSKLTVQKEINEILSSQSQTAQVLNNAKLSNDAKENVLAQTAYNNAVAKGFLVP